MKKMLAVLLILVMSFQVFGRGNRGSGCELDNLPVGEISEQQAHHLSYMWQEEKVARDVYTYLSTLYPNLRVFKNISRSEQKHMDAVKKLLVRYELEVPVVDETLGVFALPELTTLYNSLIKRGKVDLKSALQVGLDIEILDIKDLEEMVVGMPEDVTMVFGNLTKASYKHKSAFTRQLDRF